jgi:hypothetical protein
VFYRVLELAIARDPVRCRDLAASQLRVRVPLLDRRGHAGARLARNGRPPHRSPARR